MLENRIRSAALQSKVMTAQEAAALVKSDMTVGCSGFTVVGDPKAVPLAIAELGLAKNLTIMTGASVGDQLDGSLARAGLVGKRFPYQSNKDLRNGINAGTIGYADMHLSQLPRLINRGDKKVDVAIIECAAVTEDGLIPALTVGASDAYVYAADKVIVEINTTLPLEIEGMHDVFRAAYPDHAEIIPVKTPQDRIGTAFIPCPIEKIAAIVVTDSQGKFPVFKDPDAVSKSIGNNIVNFLKAEIAAGRQPASLSPLQSGVGNVANAVLAGLGESGITGMQMYTEVLQDSALQLILDGKMANASTTAVSISKELSELLKENIEFVRERMVIRPQEIANNPEVVRRLSLIAMNTPIECDLYGNVNSTHIMGTRVMNGLGGSGDFARNAGLSIFATESIAKGGDISCIVPMVSHVDHTEHDVNVIVTEQGVADLRWKTPRERAETIIENCAHPDYRPMLRAYFEEACALGGHTPHVLPKALSWHTRYVETGSMK